MRSPQEAIPNNILLLSLVFSLLLSVSCQPIPIPTPTLSAEPPSTATKVPTKVPTQIPTLSPTTEPTQTPSETPTASPEPATATLIPLGLKSSAFKNGAMIPKKYSRRGDDISPPLSWGDPPPGTESFALMVYSDPVEDGGGNWVQWILYNIPADNRSLGEGIIPDDNGMLPDGSQHFRNSWGELEYGGPNPPHVYLRNYYFVLYALDTMLDLDATEEEMRQDGTLPWIGASKAILERAVAGHLLAQGELVGKYKEE